MFPLAILDPEAIEGATSVSDKAIARALNATREGLNALHERVVALEAAPLSTSVVIEITAEQEAALEAVPVGGLFRFAGPTLDIPCQKA